MKTKIVLSTLVTLIITLSFSNISYSQFIDPIYDENVKPLKNNKFILPLTKENQPQISDAIPYAYLIFGNNSTSGNGRAPQGSRRFIRSVYLVTPAEMWASSFGVSTVRSVGWNWNNPFGASMPVSQSIQTIGTVKIYLQNTDDNNYTKGTDFSTAINGMTLVANTTMIIPTGTAPIHIDVPCEGVGTTCFRTEEEKGVYIAFEYETTLPLAIPLGAPTVHCDNLLLNSIATYQSNTVQGNNMIMSSFRPATRFSGVQTVFPEDVNSDGVVDLDDMIMLECEAFNFCCGCQCLGDINNDFCVDALDLSALANKLCLFLE